MTCVLTYQKLVVLVLLIKKKKINCSFVEFCHTRCHWFLTVSYNFLLVLDFLCEEAIDDAWTVASYLSDADMLLATFRGMLTRYNEAENVLQTAAASVAVRGVLFGNSHPSPSRLHLYP